MNRNSMSRWTVGVVAVALAVAALSCREQSDTPSASGERVVDSKTAAAIDAEIDRLIQLSDDATSLVTVTLPDGSTARGRRPKPRDIERGRDPVFPALEDPLADVARPIEIAPDSPLAFDWSPLNPSILLVVDPQGLWRWNVSSRSRSLWISNDNIGFRPRQVSANRDGRILLAEPGAAAVLVPSENGPARLLAAPESFRFNYVEHQREKAADREGQQPHVHVG